MRAPTVGPISNQAQRGEELAKLPRSSGLRRVAVSSRSFAFLASLRFTEVRIIAGGGRGQGVWRSKSMSPVHVWASHHCADLRFDRMRKIRFFRSVLRSFPAPCLAAALTWLESCRGSISSVKRPRPPRHLLG